MKKWVVIVAILVCCGLYALVKFSISQSHNANNQAEEAQIKRLADVDKADRIPMAESAGSTVPATQAEAATKVFKEFQSCLMNEKYEQAWKLTSKSYKGGEYKDFEAFKADMMGKGTEVATLNVHPESATKSGELIRLLVTSTAQGIELYVYFIEEDGQWKFDHGTKAD